MKICDEQETRRTLKDVEPGMVFRFADVKEVVLRTRDGYIYIGGRGGYAYVGDLHYEVGAIYPNACLKLGDPE